MSEVGESAQELAERQEEILNKMKGLSTQVQALEGDAAKADDAEDLKAMQPRAEEPAEEEEPKADDGWGEDKAAGGGGGDDAGWGDDEEPVEMLAPEDLEYSKVDYEYDSSDDEEDSINMEEYKKKWEAHQAKQQKENEERIA